MSGYVRQDITSQIADGNVIEADPLNEEFDALVDAFSAVSGHSHNGTLGEGSPILVLGPSQNVVVSASSVTPATDDTISLGSSTNEFKDLYIDGVANIDTLNADTANLNGIPVVSTTATQTLTNKTINLSNNTLIATSAEVAAAVTDETGTGALVFAGSPALTGTPTAPTAAAGTNTTQVATTAHVFAERSNTATLTGKTINLSNNTLTATSAQLATAVTDETGSGSLVFANSPSLTGVPSAPTAAGGTNTTQLATTAFVNSGIVTERSAAATLTNKTLTSPVVTGGTITGITDLAIADGGTGASNASDARTNLGLVIGTNVQAQDAGLQSIASLTTSANQMLYTTGADVYTTTPITSFGRSLVDDTDASAARTTLGLGSVATQNSASVTITGGTITGITDLAVADGGTGASDASGARSNLGLVLTTSQVDTTTGRVVKVGDYGLGAGNASIQHSGSADDIIAGAFVAGGSVTETVAVSRNYPALGGGGSDTRWWNVVSFGQTNRQTQIATEINGVGTTKGRTFIRVRENTTWTAWKEVAQALGAVIAMGADQAAARAAIGLGTLAVVSPTGSADATTFLRGDGTWSRTSLNYLASQNLPSNYTFDFTGLPTDVKEVIVHLSGVSTNGAAGVFVGLGTGYTHNGYSVKFAATNHTSFTDSSGVQLTLSAAADSFSGKISLIRTSETGGSWNYDMTGRVGTSPVFGAGTFQGVSAPAKIVIQSLDAGQNFDAGSVSVAYR